LNYWLLIVDIALLGLHSLPALNSSRGQAGQVAVRFEPSFGWPGINIYLAVNRRLFSGGVCLRGHGVDATSRDSRNQAVNGYLHWSSYLYTSRGGTG